MNYRPLGTILTLLKVTVVLVEVVVDHDADPQELIFGHPLPQAPHWGPHLALLQHWLASGRGVRFLYTSHPTTLATLAHMD